MNKKTNGHKIEEGALYKSVEIEGVRFDVYYGYENDEEREHWEPSPIYPRFTEAPQYTCEGIPFALAYQEVCELYDPIKRFTDFVECDNCHFFDKREEFIGLCRCKDRQMRKNE